MTGVSGKQNTEDPYGNWEMVLGALETLLSIGDPFPDQDGFFDSIWRIWKERIENGHNEEEKQIQSMYKEWKEQIGYSNDPSFDPDEWASDDYWQACRVTNSMYAALVVSMWSEMESFLRSIVSICSEALEKQKKNNEPHQFKEILRKLKNFGIQVDQCANYLTVDAIRILNNSYKHSNGCYRPKEGRPYTRIDQTLISKWKIVKDQNEGEIDYSRLPIQEMVVDCNRFCSDLFGRVKAVLESKAG
ncbi:MAG: hypothetical protein JRJ66_13675 [Deltaproteobacteria bacterium]|nr:hypothetical protein [Deltaproteobacteria bacterium]MBW2046165.1 hypothetical protein [Deltaproteobacteria bacterium]